MRICQSCGRENPPDQDFCQCGEYLRWDPTGVVQAVTPEVLEQHAAESAPPAAQDPPAGSPPPAQVTPAAPVTPSSPGNGHSQPPAPPAAAAPPPPPPPAPRTA